MKAAFIGGDPQTADLATLALHMRWPGVRPIVATTAAEGLEMVERETPDLVLLHPDFADMPTASVIRELRRINNVPLLILEHQGDETDLAIALESGADDYVRMPCGLTEITIRIWALLRRVGIPSTTEGDGPLSCGRLSLNPFTSEVYLADQRVTLTPTEFRLLRLLVTHRGAVVDNRTLERGLRGGYIDGPRLVRRHVQRLRRKLGDDPEEPSWIASVQGVGYRFMGPLENHPLVPVSV